MSGSNPSSLRSKSSSVPEELLREEFEQAVRQFLAWKSLLPAGSNFHRTGRWLDGVKQEGQYFDLIRRATSDSFFVAGGNRTPALALARGEQGPPRPVSGTAGSPTALLNTTP